MHEFPRHLDEAFMITPWGLHEDVPQLSFCEAVRILVSHVLVSTVVSTVANWRIAVFPPGRG